MNYLILDLEWNNTFGRKVTLNEIIEIGAVLLGPDLAEIGRFSTLVKPQIGRKLNARTKRLTHITNEEIRGGLSFHEALKRLESFIGGEEAAMLSWGDGDLRVLIENLNCFFHTERIPFLQYYLDLQRYYHLICGRSMSQQIALSGAAAELGIDPDRYALHRALDDSLLSADCFRAVFDRARVDQMVQKCDEQFYRRFLFKPYIIKDLSNPAVDPGKMVCLCDRCGGSAQRTGPWKFFNGAFHAPFFCRTCRRKLNFSIRFKQYFDRVEVKTRTTDGDGETSHANANKSAETDVRKNQVISAKSHES